MQGVVSSILALLIYISSCLGLIPSAGSRDESEPSIPAYTPPVQAAAPAKQRLIARISDEQLLS